MTKTLHERLHEAIVYHVAPAPEPLVGANAPHCVITDAERHKHVDDTADYAVDALAFRKGMRQHLLRVEAKVDALMAAFAQLFEDAEPEEEVEVHTLDGDQVPPARDQNQSLG